MDRFPTVPALRRLPGFALLALLIGAINAGFAEDLAQPITWPEPGQHGVTVLAWTAPCTDAATAQASPPVAPPADLHLPIGGDGTFRTLVLDCPRAGTLVLAMDCPRPLKAWVGDQAVLDQALPWRDPQRRVQVALLLPVTAGKVAVTIQVGPRSIHPGYVDEHCPSRHRAEVLAMVLAAQPDVLTLAASLQEEELPRCTLRFSPSQFRKDGVAFQEVPERLHGLA